MLLHKFGGTSLASAALYERVAGIVTGGGDAAAVVVSAMSGVTDALLRAVGLGTARDPACEEVLRELAERHLSVVREVVAGERAVAVAASIEADLCDVRDVLRASALLGVSPEVSTELVVGYGEVWSARILHGVLERRGVRARWLDARQVLTVERDPLAPGVDWGESRRRLAAFLAEDEPPEVLVITGFVARLPDGTATTLGRNGSDYSASIFAALLGAREIHLWTDVDGVMSANPRLVPEAVLLDELSYEEAMELAYFGAKVIHPSTMAPALEKGIPVFIRNTFNPAHRGTRIHVRGAPEFAVKGLATVEHVALLNLEGTGMIGVPGTAHRLFGALREIGVSVIMISQASSEHSICFAVPAREAGRARAAVERAFALERQHGHIQRVTVDAGCTILAVVGDGMAGQPGVAARLFNALGRAGVNVRAIAQGASERNISVVVDEREATRALRAVHSGFYLSPQTISIGVIGAGVVGGAFLDQLAGQAERLRRENGIDLRVRALMSSRRMVLDDRALEIGGWRELLGACGREADLEAFVAHVHAEHLPHTAIIDCTASEAIAGRYAAWLRQGIHVITPNKRAGTAPLAAYRALRASAREGRAHYLYETTVGAGLPILQTLRDLIQTGDEVLRIEGVLSGTLSFLFNAFDGRRPFSEILREARERGYTEPDPREDLSGLDVARKIVILGREAGLALELGDVEVQGLVPADAREGSVEDFFAALRRHDEAMQRLLAETAAAERVLRFVGLLDAGGRARVRLDAYPEAHAFGRLNLTDNVVQFRTARYREHPLVVQGPGAGPDVTAGGVFADLLRLAAYLGATL